MKQNEEKILLGHGSGGNLMHALIEEVFMKYFDNPILKKQTDSAILNIGSNDIAFTTDSFVIDPVFFPGGDIGKLAVCGTVNDLAVSGATPLYLSVSFIIEEGFPMKDLLQIVKSLANEAKKAGVTIVTGDTKVVNKGKCDKIFINTTGVGRMDYSHSTMTVSSNINIGDLIIVNGSLGDHGMAVMNARESFNFKTKVQSDCSSLNHLIKEVTDHCPVKFMRDPTRGGVATVLNELVQICNLGIEITESNLPIKKSVKAMCELLGLDALHIANEGKVLMVIEEEYSQRALGILKKNSLGAESCIIGKIVDNHHGKVVLRNETGGNRIVESLSGDQLPRIC